MFLTCICSGQVKYPVFPDPELGGTVGWTKVIQPGHSPKWSTYLICDETDVKAFEIDRKGKGFNLPENKDKSRKVISIITLKPGCKLMSLTELIRYFKIPDRKRYPIVVDDRFQRYPDHIYAVKTAVAYVTVATHRHTKKKVIYIRTKRPIVERVG